MLVVASVEGESFIPLSKIVGIKYVDAVMTVNGVDGTYFSDNVDFIDKISFALAGDVNRDGIVDVADVTKLVAMILDETSATNAGDVNADGAVDVADVTNVVKIILL